MAKPEDSYSSVPNAQPQVGSPSDYLNVQASPASFGSQIGSNIQEAGAKMQQGDQELFNTGLQYQGMLNESAATDLATQAQIKRDNINAQYKTMEGFDAVGARDQAISDLAQVRQDVLAQTKNPAVARAYNLLDHRQEAFSINEANTWGVTQGHAAAVNSADSSVKLSVSQSSTPSVAMDDNRFTDSLANIKFNTARKMSLLGFGQDMTQDPKTGDVTFDDTPHGRAGASVYQQELNTNLGQAWNNKLQQEAAANPIHAQSVLDKYKDKIPPAVSAEWSYKLRGAVDAADTATFGDSQLAQSEADYYKNLAPSSGPIGTAPSWLHTATQTQESQNNPNAVSSVGAKGLMQVMPNTLTDPGYGVTKANITPDMTSDQKTSELKRVGDDYLDAMYKKYNGNPMQALVAYNWGPGHADNWIKQGGNFQQLPPETQVYLSKILPKGMGAQGGSLNQVDYYRQNEPQILQSTFTNAMQRFGDITLANQSVAHVEQKISLLKQQSNDQLLVQRDQLAAIITGDANHPPIRSMADLNGPNASPQVKTLWTDYAGKDYFGPIQLENLVKANNVGQAKTYGTDFYNQLQGVLTGKTTTADDLGPYMKLTNSSNPDSAGVTNTGYPYLKDQITQLHDPKTGATNQAFALQESKFLTEMHAEATGSNIYKDIQSPKFTQDFNNKLPAILQRMNEDKADGKDIFNKESKDYAAKYFQLPKPSDIILEHNKELFGQVGIPYTTGPSGTQHLIQTLEDPSVDSDTKRQMLEDTVFKDKKLSGAQGDVLGRKYGLYNYSSKPAPGSSLSLPTGN